MSGGRDRASWAPLRVMYQRLVQSLGPQGWWPAESPFEMMVGAMLTQATNWHNVERAIRQLRRIGGLDPHRLAGMSSGRVRRAVRPAGYFRQKTKRLKAFTVWFLTRYAASPRRMFRVPWRALREELLELHGIGPETADSILLYAGGQPVFVIDAYTMRVFRRHRLISGRTTYDEVQRWAMQALPAEAQRYNEFHALLVAVGKQFCHRRNPDCGRCPLGDLPHTVR